MIFDFVTRLKNPFFLLVFAVSLAACDVNAVPRLDEQVSASWSQVENQYQRRADLVPNLVATVQGFATQEREVLQNVVEARAKVGQMQIPDNILQNPDALKMFEQNQGALSSALSRLLVVAERYPDLKSNQNFLALQSQLEGTENRLAVARRDYIAAVRDYNTELRTIPGKWIASVMYPEAELKPTFTATVENADQAPKVNFSSGS
ncbi:MAG: LemA family protein [Alphaproteobacteria bacterium]|jgi:LemA protein|nr:LemA family protein [Alphaproteobacteria bacterium]